MVDLNFTLVVQLLMFLGFLWLMDHFVLRPLLKIIDKREGAINEDKEHAQADQVDAERLEQEYANALASAHVKANNMVAKALRGIQDEHNAQCNSLRETQQQEVNRIRKEAKALVSEQRSAFPEFGKTIAQTMMNRLGLGGEVL